MEDSKPWYTSKSIWGSVMVVVSAIVALFGVKIDEATQTVIIDEGTALAAAIGNAIGAALAIWGRLKATKSITPLAKPPST